MDLFENAITRYALLATSVLVLAGLGYVVGLAVRALFRQARGIAHAAGHAQVSASLRAAVRMTIWAAFFGLFYLFAFYVGKRLGWWAAPVIVAALAGMIWGLLTADRLLTVPPGRMREEAGIAVTLIGMLGVFAAGIVLAVRP
jgi:hypothetical protein